MTPTAKNIKRIAQFSMIISVILLVVLRWMIGYILAWLAKQNMWSLWNDHNTIVNEECCLSATCDLPKPDLPVTTIKKAILSWRHQTENFSALLAICAGNSPVPGEFPTQRPVTRSFDVFFDLRLNKRLSKQSWGWWFDTLSSSLWRHCNAL